MPLTLFTSPGCHLCEQAEEMPDYLDIQCNLVDISSQIDLIRLYGVRVPVLKRADGSELDWPFDTLDVERFTA